MYRVIMHTVDKEMPFSLTVNAMHETAAKNIAKRLSNGCRIRAILYEPEVKHIKIKR